jgi:hypothetical protein
LAVNVKLKSVFVWLRRLFLWLVTLLSIILALVIVVLQSSNFQSYITKRILAEISAKTGHEMSIEKIDVKWFDKIIIYNASILDYQDFPMLQTKTLTVDFELQRILSTKSLAFDAVKIDDGFLRLVNYEDTSSINIVQFIKSLQNLKPQVKDSTSTDVALGIDKISIDQFQFSYHDETKDSLKQSLFDYGHFRLDIKDLLSYDFNVDQGELDLHFDQILVYDSASHLSVEDLRGDFHLKPNYLGFSDLNLSTSHSNINGSIGMNFESIQDLSDFVNKVSLDVSLKSSELSSRDLDYFVNIPLDPFTFKVDGNLSGTIPRLDISELLLSFGTGTSLEGRLSLFGLPNITETFIDADFKNANVVIKDLDAFTDRMVPELYRFGEVDIRGRFSGFLNDFVATAAFTTKLGNVKSDLNLKFKNGIDDAKYSGRLVLDRFELGQLLNRSEVGQVSLDGTIKGQGTRVKNAEFFLDANLKQSEILQYRYQSIHTRGDFAAEFFNGFLSIKDPNCKLDLEGSIDLNEQSELIKISGEIDTLNLFALGFSSDTLALSGSVSADLTGLALDSIVGSVRMVDLNIIYGNRTVIIDSIRVASKIQNERRVVILELAEAKIELQGNFLFSRIFSDITKIAAELRSYFDPNDEAMIVQSKSEQTENRYSVDFLIELYDVRKYGKWIFGDDFYISPNETIEGTFYQRRNATLAIFGEFDSLNIKGFGLSKNLLDFNFSKAIDSAGIIASGFISSEKQWYKGTSTEDLSIEAVWFNKKISLNTRLSQPETNSSLYLNGELNLYDDKLTFNFLPSRLIAFDERWLFNPFNKITYQRDILLFDRMELYQNEQSIRLKGIYSPVTEMNLDLLFNDFHIRTLSTVLPIHLEGIVNASIIVNREAVDEPIILESDFDIAGFNLDGFDVGDISGSTSWDAERKGMEINLNVNRASVNTISLNGIYSPFEIKDQLDIEVHFEEANLELLDPLLAGLFSDMKGFATGDLRVNGSLNSPKLIGSSKLTNGSFRFDYLGTTYNFDGDISFTTNSIDFVGVKLFDRNNNRASLNGSIFHSGLKNFRTDLKIAANNFHFLNTTFIDNNLYYGSAYATGDITVTGPVNDLVINAKATTERGTRFFIPLSNDTEVSQKEYITFVDFADTTNTLDINQIIKESISGITLNFELDVTPDAYVELIFDIRTGDIIRGRGEGNLSLSLDTNGEFELFGDLNITEGGYNFTIPAIGINKEFNVVPGSRISWYGDPYAGILDMKATYRQLASFDDFNGTTEGEGIQQKYPILVSLNLTGEMLAPSINFNISIEETQSSPTSNVRTSLYNINNDEQELKRQVFSLLILRKFSPRSSFSVGGTALQGSISEFLSNQLSYFISQVDENLEIDMDLTSLDQNAFNTFQLRLAYTFLDGRLRVSGGGAIPQDNTQTQTTSAYLGDWAVRYLLTPDGHLRIKAFSQTEEIANQLQRESGLSFQYVKSFDDFKELLTKTREEAIKSKPKDVTKERSLN